MPASPSGPHLQDVTRRWHGLATRRLQYYMELYRSGRWKHYYTPESFAVRMLDVIKVVRTWDELAGHQQAQTSPQRDDRLRPAA